MSLIGDQRLKEQEKKSLAVSSAITVLYIYIIPFFLIIQTHKKLIVCSDKQLCVMIDDIGCLFVSCQKWERNLLPLMGSANRVDKF